MKREFMVERQGRWFVLYAGLLDEAHSQGLKSIKTQLIQTPSPDNGYVAICFAEVATEKGTFTGLGDASPENVARMMVPHLIRMAETRAKARALRDSINVGVTALEELADMEDASEPQETGPHHRERAVELGRPEIRSEDPTPRPTPIRPPAPPLMPNGGLATPNQIRAIYSIARDQLALAESQVDEKCVGMYGAPPAELTRKQASDLISALRAKEIS